MITSIIVDDEIKGRETLATLLDRYCSDVSVVGAAGNIIEAGRLVAELNPDLVFLDISMPGGTGFELLEQLGNTDLEVIFVTAHSEYAIQAIKANALDYILKPISISELQEAVRRAEKRLSDKKSSGDVRILLQRLSDPMPERKLAISVADGIQFVPLAQIIRLSAKGSYTEIFCTTGTILSSRPLKDYEYKLPATQFFRAHHSHIINLSCVMHYHRGDGGYVTMTDGSVIDISKRKKASFLELFHI